MTLETMNVAYTVAPYVIGGLVALGAPLLGKAAVGLANGCRRVPDATRAAWKALTAQKPAPITQKDVDDAEARAKAAKIGAKAIKQLQTKQTEISGLEAESDRLTEITHAARSVLQSKAPAKALQKAKAAHDLSDVESSADEDEVSSSEESDGEEGDDSSLKGIVKILQKRIDGKALECGAVKDDWKASDGEAEIRQALKSKRYSTSQIDAIVSKLNFY
ncbi:MAG: hypothetical protein K1X28_01045 [Parachlamydiales bacterium]|nr:hypothetical protein [Parachlamydiales bacterium]